MLPYSMNSLLKYVEKLKGQRQAQLTLRLESIQMRVMLCIDEPMILTTLI